MLQDGHGRRIDYLRVSITDRCDMRCIYCMPEGFCNFEARADRLTAEEIERIVAAFAALGVNRVRLTGGEPLTRRDAADIATRIGRLPGIDDLSMTTNGTLLARYAGDLRKAGVRRLNVSLDTLDPRRFRSITRTGTLESVFRGLDAARTAGFAPIKINMVVLAGVNDHEVEEIGIFCSARGFVLRLIEVMPLGESGRQAPAVGLDRIRRRLQERFDLVDAVVSGGGPARYLKSADDLFSIGFITPMSQHFCATCNRVRLSADGRLILCLGQENSLDLRTLVRAGASQEALMQAIRTAVARKPERHDFISSPARMDRIMAQTGG